MTTRGRLHCRSCYSHCHPRRVAAPLLLLLLLPILIVLYINRPFSHSQFPDHWRHRSRGDNDEAVLDIIAPMPGRFSGSDVYLCTSYSLPSNATLYLVRFEPLGVTEPHQTGQQLLHVHHMLLAVCDQLPFGVAAPPPSWNCGAMMSAGADESAADLPSSMEMCTSGLSYVYAYAMQAPLLRLPEGVAFPVGGWSGGGGYLVLQVHYTHLTSDNHVSPKPRGQHLAPVPTGVRLGLLKQPRPPPERLAGVHLSATGGFISPRSIAHLSSGCPYTGDSTLHPFAFRVHTHRLGRVVSVYRVRRRYHGNDGQHRLVWSLIGRANPQLAQMFYPVNDSDVQLKPGDSVAAACVMENPSSRLVRIGPSADDEMCNAYLMYWYSVRDGGRGGGDHGCMSKGYSDMWVEAPDWVAKQAATVPGTDRYLPVTEGWS